MAEFEAKKIDNPNQELNQGKGKYRNGVDIPNADDWNKIIDSQLWVQKLAENPIDNSEANNVGEAELQIVMRADNTPQLKAKNLKGNVGSGTAIYGSNPNLLINSNFAINQRTLATYNTGGYCVDRWKASYGTPSITVLSNGIKFVNLSSDNNYLKQVLENKWQGQTITLSVNFSEISMNTIGRLAVYYSNNGTKWTIINAKSVFSLGICSLTVTIPAASYISFDVGCSGASVTANNQVTILWAKAELGSQATAYTPPDPATELLKCQRYYQCLTVKNEIGTAVQEFLVGVAVPDSSTQARMRYAFNVPMREIPTLTVKGLGDQYSASDIVVDISDNITACSLMGVEYAGNDIISADLIFQNIGISFDINSLCNVCVIYNSTTPKTIFAFDAEL